MISNTLVFVANIVKNNLSEDELIMVLEEFGGVPSDQREKIVQKYKEGLE